MEIINIVRRLAIAVRKRKEAQDQLYHLFLTQSIGQKGTVKGHRALARLIRQGYFVTILTSNMDTALETALEQEGLHSSQYTVLTVGRDENDKILDALEVSHSEISIVKLPFSQSQSGQVLFPPELSSDIQSSLQRYFNQNIIIVGYIDQEEEAKAALHFHDRGGIYYVRQAAPDYSDIIVKCINKQNKHPEDFIITETYGEFNTFFSTLETLINNGSDWIKTFPDERHLLAEDRGMQSSGSITVKLPPVEDENGESQGSTLPVKQRARSTVFISYSHKDDLHLQRLLTHLKLLQRDSLISVDSWSDKKIKAGERWKEEIMQAIEASNIAILLISADFLASDFITDVELPALETAADRREMKILPVIVGFCDYEHTTLARFQSVNNPATPLSKTSYDDNEKVWKAVVVRIRGILST